MELGQEVIHGQSQSDYQLAGSGHSSDHSMTQVFESDWTQSRDWGGVLGRLGVLAPLSKLEATAIFMSLLVCLSCIVGMLVMHYHNSQIQIATEQYIQKTAEIQKQTKNLSENITQQYNYGKISEVAQDGDMTVDKSQIRNVDHE